jgi:hypothetical protein
MTTLKSFSKWLAHSSSILTLFFIHFRQVLPLIFVFVMQTSRVYQGQLLIILYKSVFHYRKLRHTNRVRSNMVDNFRTKMWDFLSRPSLGFINPPPFFLQPFYFYDWLSMEPSPAFFKGYNILSWKKINFYAIWWSF